MPRDFLNKDGGPQVETCFYEQQFIEFDPRRSRESAEEIEYTLQRAIELEEVETCFPRPQFIKMNVLIKERQAVKEMVSDRLTMFEEYNMLYKDKGMIDAFTDSVLKAWEIWKKKYKYPLKAWDSFNRMYEARDKSYVYGICRSRESEEEVRLVDRPSIEQRIKKMCYSTMSNIKVGKVEIKIRPDVLQTVPVTKPQTGGQKKEYTAAPANLSSLQTSWCVMILRWIVVILSIIHLTQCVKFGPDNSYTCHCFNDEPCNKDTGYCSGGCDIGWSGAACQKQNLALNKPSGQIKINRTRREANNVPTKSANTDMTRKWWGVDLLEEYPIKHIIIQPNWDVSSADAFLLYVIKENEEPELCYKERVGVSPPHVKDIKCNQVITGRYVIISNDYIRHSGRYLTFCQVEIYVCSVGTFGSDCSNFCHCLNNERCSENGECPNGCSDGWTGTTCSQGGEDQSLTIIVTIVVVIVVLAIVTGIVIAVKYRNRRTQSRNTVPQQETIDLLVTPPSGNNHYNYSVPQQETNSLNSTTELLVTQPSCNNHYNYSGSV